MPHNKSGWMLMKNLFDPADVSGIRERMAHLRPDSERQWGKMNVAQMLAHCSAAIGMAEGKVTSAANLAWKTARTVGQEITHREWRANAPKCDDREERAGDGRTGLHGGAATVA